MYIVYCNKFEKTTNPKTGQQNLTSFVIKPGGRKKIILPKNGLTIFENQYYLMLIEDRGTFYIAQKIIELRNVLTRIKNQLGSKKEVFEENQNPKESLDLYKIELFPKIDLIVSTKSKYEDLVFEYDFKEKSKSIKNRDPMLKFEIVYENDRSNSFNLEDLNFYLVTKYDIYVSDPNIKVLYNEIKTEFGNLRPTFPLIPIDLEYLNTKKNSLTDVTISAKGVNLSDYYQGLNIKNPKIEIINNEAILPEFDDKRVPLRIRSFYLRDIPELLDSVKTLNSSLDTKINFLLLMTRDKDYHTDLINFSKMFNKLKLVEISKEIENQKNNLSTSKVIDYVKGRDDLAKSLVIENLRKISKFSKQPIYSKTEKRDVDYGPSPDERRPGGTIRQYVTFEVDPVLGDKSLTTSGNLEDNRKYLKENLLSVVDNDLKTKDEKAVDVLRIQLNNIKYQNDRQMELLVNKELLKDPSEYTLEEEFVENSFKFKNNLMSESDFKSYLITLLS